MKYDLTCERAAYNVLKSVFIEKAYSSIELDRALPGVPEEYRARVTALVYGTLERSVTLDYYITALTKKPPKNNIQVLLKLAIYDLVFGSGSEYTAVDRYVSFAKDRFPGAHGFVNAVLRCAKSITLPDGGDDFSLSVRFSVPQWAVKRLRADYGERAVSLLAAQQVKATHIRRNTRLIGGEEFEKLLTAAAGENGLTKTDYGYYVKRNVLNNLDAKIFTAQSLSSMRAANAYVNGLGSGIKILDLCAAPGGKSVYMSELCGADVTACDIHPHRVELIKAYAARMECKLTVLINDASVYNEEWDRQFDLVVVDAPCSGSGLLKSSPEILLFKSDGDVERLSKLQSGLLDTAVKYVKPGGVLAYSTCSLFNAENENIADGFFSAHKNEFEPASDLEKFGERVGTYIKILPDNSGSDGFFIAKWKRSAAARLFTGKQGGNP